jgi:N-acetylmuramoyl-L-alanine amidase
MKAVAGLCRGILARHPIPARNVVAHSDVAPDRKEDPGEFFDWRWLAAQGIGLWPDFPKMVADTTVDEESMRADLATFGYRVPLPEAGEAALASVLRAFQRHWRPVSVSGAADAETALRASVLASSVQTAG